METIDRASELPLTRSEKKDVLEAAIMRLHRRLGGVPSIGEVRREIQSLFGNEAGAKLYPRSTVGAALSAYERQTGLIRDTKVMWHHQQRQLRATIFT